MFFRSGLPNLVNLAATAAVALAVVYFQKWRIELPVSLSSPLLYPFPSCVLFARRRICFMSLCVSCVLPVPLFLRVPPVVLRLHVLVRCPKIVLWSCVSTWNREAAFLRYCSVASFFVLGRGAHRRQGSVH